MTSLVRIIVWLVFALGLAGAYTLPVLAGWWLVMFAGLSASSVARPLALCGTAMVFLWAGTLYLWWRDDAFADIYRWLGRAKLTAR